MATRARQAETARFSEEMPLPAAAVLRDGAVGATRWAFAALVVKLAQEGHCTLVRTRKRRWIGTGPVVTVDLHADPTGLTPFEMTILRQLGRHDTLDGFGFAGSTFRRRTLRDVRDDLIERGWLVDRHRRSNMCLVLGLTLLGIGLVASLGPLLSAMATGLGTGSLLAATARFPVTETGAHHRATHRAYAQSQYDRLRAHGCDVPERADRLLSKALPHLILERMGTPRRLRAIAAQREAAEISESRLDWVRDEEGTDASLGDDCRTLGHVLTSLGCQPISDRLRWA